MNRVIPIMGIDPSFRATGVALAHYHLDTDRIEVTSLHLLKTEKTKTKTVRRSSDDLACATHLFTELHRLRTEHQPVITLAEVPSGTQNARSSWALGITLGVLASFPAPLVELTAMEVKRGFTGNKTASKEAMIQSATELHPELPWVMHRGAFANKNEHLADAVGVLHAGIKTTVFRELVRMVGAIPHAGPEMAGTP